MQTLKYLFVVSFKDGSSFIQPPDDTSTSDAKRSAFFDVLQRESEIDSFTLFEVDAEPADRKHFTVMLNDGSFSVNGIQFKMHDQEDLVGFKLIFFRKNQIHINQEMIADGKGGWSQGKATKLGQETTYRMGWQAHDSNGNNVQRIMEFE